MRSDNGIVKEPKFTFNLLEHLNSHELKILTLVSKQRAIEVMNYVYTYLRPYTQVDVKSIPANVSDLNQQKRAVALAVTFNTSHLETILKAHPEILSIALEKRKVTVRDPVSNQSFTATWHFKLSHLLAAEGNKEAFAIVKSSLSDNKAHLLNFLSEPVYWEAVNGNGKYGPTPGAIAIYYNQQDFFYEIANHITLIPQTGFDDPYNKINFCNIVLFVAASTEKHDYFYALLNSQDSIFKESVSMIEECMNFCILQAISGNKAFLNILMNYKFSANSIILLDSSLRLAIDSTDVDLVKLISKKMNAFNYFCIDGYNVFQNDSPLYHAMVKAVKDKKYLEIVKVFLSIGCSIEKKEYELIKNEKPLLTIFSKETHEHKLVRECCNASTYFREFIFSGCHDAYADNHFFTQLDPQKLLARTANLDKLFFNDLIEACLEDEFDCILYRYAMSKHFNREEFFTALQDFIKEHEGLNYFTGRTLEKIGDSVMKLWNKTNPANDKLQILAQFFYEKVITAKDMRNGCYQSAVNKLHEMDKRHEVVSVPFIEEKKRSRSRM